MRALASSAAAALALGSAAGAPLPHEGGARGVYSVPLSRRVHRVPVHEAAERGLRHAGGASAGNASTHSSGGATLLVRNRYSAETLPPPSSDASHRRLQDEVDLYGDYRALAYFYSDVYVGTPPQKFTVITDTGSSLMAVPCKGCADCGRHMNPPFDPSSSSTASTVACGQPYCTGCAEGGICQYSQGYAEGSSISGVYYQDKVFVGDDHSSDAAHAPFVVDFVFGCQKHEGGLFTTQLADGIMGVGQSDRSITRALQQQGKLKANMFSLCLSLNGGAMTLGDMDARLHQSPPKWAALTTQGFYVVRVDGLAAGGQALSVSDFSAGNTILDSGTTFTYLPTGAFRAVEAAITQYCADDPSSRCKGERTTVAGEGLCYNLPNPADIATFPDVTITLHGAAVNSGAGSDGSPVAIRVPPEHVFINMGWDRGAYCLAFYDNGAGHGAVIGANSMMGYDVVFDMSNQGSAAPQRVGWAPSRCVIDRSPPSPSPSATPSKPPASGGGSGGGNSNPPAAPSHSVTPSPSPPAKGGSTGGKTGGSGVPGGDGSIPGVDGVPQPLDSSGAVVAAAVFGSLLGALCVGCLCFYAYCGGIECRIGRMSISVTPKGSGASPSSAGGAGAHDLVSVVTAGGEGGNGSSSGSAGGAPTRRVEISLPSRGGRKKGYANLEEDEGGYEVEPDEGESESQRLRAPSGAGRGSSGGARGKPVTQPKVAAAAASRYRDEVGPEEAQAEAARRGGRGAASAPAAVPGAVSGEEDADDGVQLDDDLDLDGDLGSGRGPSI